jgi:hypothetical protein
MEQNLEWFFRQAWRRLAGLPQETLKPPPPSLDALRRTQWNEAFEELMRNRLLMGAFRYGTFSEQRHRRHDNAGSMEKHLTAYRETGNAEHLVDIANLALVEFTLPAHPNFHWQSLDDGDHHATEIAIQ